MARVPTAQPSVNINSPGPVYQSTAGASLAAFGSNQAAGLDTIGQSLQHIGGIAMEDAIQKQDEDNVREAKQLDTAYASAIRGLVYGDGTEANPGFYAMQGQNAVSASADIAAKINELRQHYLGQASNQRVAEKFDLASAARADSELSQVAVHTAKERIAANTDASNARIDEAQNNLVLGASNPQVWDQSSSIIRSEIVAQAKTRGEGQDWINANFSKLVSESAAKAVSSAALTDLGAAQKILADHRTEMSGVAVAQAEQAIKEAENRARVQAEHNMIMAQRAQEIQASRTMTDYLQKVIAGQPVDLGQMASDPALAQDPAKIENIIAFTKSFTDLQKQNNKITTDGNTYSTLWQLIHLPDGNPNKLTNPDDLNQFVGTGPGHLTPEDVVQLRKEVLGADTPDGKIEAELKDQFFKTVQQTLTRANPLIGIADPKGQESVTKFMAWFLPEYEKQRQAGKSAVDLLNPDSKDYLGKNLSSLQRSPSQMMEDIGISNPTSDLGSVIPKITSQDQYDKLSPGSRYTDDSGKIKIKPQAPTGQ